MPHGPRRRRFRTLAGAAAVSALLLLLPLAVVLGQEGSTVSSAPLEVHTAAGVVVKMTTSATPPFVFTPDYISDVLPGENVTIDVTNLGATPHTFTLTSLVNYTLSTSSGNLTSTFLVTHPPLVAVNITAAVGAVTVVSFTAPTQIGVYQWFCTETGHFADGMEGFLGVDESVTPPSTNTGPGLPVFIIAGTIVSLVVIAIVLGFVVGRREGTKHEMPPERLGYPEVPAEPPKEPPRSP